MRYLLAALFTLVGAVANADTGQLMNEVEQNLSKTSLLEAKFHQKTTLPFMEMALESDGKFCFDIRDRQKPMIFWEYQKPDISGFLYQNGQASFWTAEGGRTLSDSEMGFLKGMTDQILQWISFDPSRLEKIYTVTQTGPRSLRFEPREKSRLFAAIELALSEDLMKLDSLAFHGKNGEITTILFDVEDLNKPLSEACRK